MQFGRDFPPVWWCTRWLGGGCAHWVCSGGRRSLTWRAGPATCTLARDPGSSQSHPAGRGHRRSRWTQRPSPSGPPQTQFVLNRALLVIELEYFLMLLIKHKRIYLNMNFDMMAREMDEDYGIDISIYGLFSPSPNSALSSHIHNIKIHKNHGKRFKFQVQRLNLEPRFSSLKVWLQSPLQSGQSLQLGGSKARRRSVQGWWGILISSSKSTWEFRNKNSHYWHITFKTTHSQVTNETHQDQRFQECPHESLHNQRRHLSTVLGLWFSCLLWPGQGRVGQEWSRRRSMSTAQCSVLTMLASQ